MAKIAVLAQKRPFFDPKKGPKITFSLKLYFLHSLAKNSERKKQKYGQKG